MQPTKPGGTGGGKGEREGGGKMLTKQRKYRKSHAVRGRCFGKQILLKISCEIQCRGRNESCMFLQWVPILWAGACWDQITALPWPCTGPMILVPAMALSPSAHPSRFWMPLPACLQPPSHLLGQAWSRAI